MALRFEVTERGGDQVVTAKNVSVAVGTHTLVERFSGTLERTGVVGIIGRNGAGKSTLLRALLGEHPLHGGELRLGASITTGYYRQDLSQVPLDGTLYEVIAVLRPKWERGHAAAVSAAEEQALRQVHERHRVAPSPKSDPRKDLRRAQRELEEAEAAVAALESEVARVVAALEDPALYTRPDGAATARTLGAQLETLKHDLDAGLERWTRATEQVEMRAPR